MSQQRAPGGIDLNASKLNLQKQGTGVDIKFDPAMIAQFRAGNFNGINPVITSINARCHVEQVEWLKPRSRVTKRFAEDIYKLTSIATNAEVGWYLGLDDEKVYRIDFEMLESLAAKRLEPVPAAKNMSVDEVSWRKYYRYLTNVIDIEIRKASDDEDGRAA